MIIPTRHKPKLPKTLSWPLGAEAVSAALAGEPHAADLTLSFHDCPVWPASSFRRMLEESVPYALLVATYRPTSRPGYAGSNAFIERGLYEATWELQVNPVPPALRSAAGTLLRDRGLPAIVSWLRGSEQPGWLSIHHRIELVFAPLEGTLIPKLTDRV